MNKSRKMSPLFFLVFIPAIMGLFPIVLGNGFFSFNNYVQMSLEQKLLVTIDQTNNLLYGIEGLLASVVFILIAVYIKISKKEVNPNE